MTNSAIKVPNTSPHVISERCTPYDIIEVMKDPAYPKFFLNRFKIWRDIAVAYKHISLAYVFYIEDPEQLYYDAIDEIEKYLGRSQASAATMPLFGRRGRNPILQNIVLPAVGDWICEKEHKPRPFEPLTNYVKSIKMNYKDSYVWKERNPEEAESRKAR